MKVLTQQIPDNVGMVLDAKIVLLTLKTAFWGDKNAV